MTDVLKGNFTPKNKVSVDTEKKETLEERFERTAKKMANAVDDAAITRKTSARITCSMAGSSDRPIQWPSAPASP